MEEPNARPLGKRGLRADSGAAAVEFALVSTVFFLLLFGIIQYGLYFNDCVEHPAGRS